MMSGIRGKNTSPELVLRRGLHRRGFRFRLHPPHLPGKPDLVFPRHRAVLFAHGCFWPQHNCPLFKWPKTRESFWRNKLKANVARDEDAISRLRRDGWRVAIVWECALKGSGSLLLAHVLERCEEWLHSSDAFLEVRGSEARSPL